MIDQIYTESPFYGYRKMTKQLQLEGMQVNHKAVARHMREMGLEAVYPGPNLSKRAHQVGIYPYLLKNSTASTPNYIWGIDITCTSRPSLSNIENPHPFFTTASERNDNRT